jgi:hypothetical protein
MISLETKKSKTSADNLNLPKGNEANLLDAASQVKFIFYYQIT